MTVNTKFNILAMEFDEYKVPRSNLSGKEYSWYAVLVWCGWKPSPKYCFTKKRLDV